MAYLPINGDLQFSAVNVLPYVNQGKSFLVSGSYTTTPGVPSSQLLASTNTVLGYFNGQMLAYAAGDGTGIFAGLTAGAMVNFDPLSTDTGQKIWNGYVICDAGMQNALAINTTYAGSLQCATAKNGWTMRPAFFYAGKTPALDQAAVLTALQAADVVFSKVETPSGSGSYETIFAY